MDIMAQNQNIDQEKVANMQHLRATQNEQAVAHRYGEQALQSEEYQRAQQQRQQRQRNGEKVWKQARSEQADEQAAAQQDPQVQGEQQRQQQEEAERQRQAEIQRQQQEQEQAERQQQEAQAQRDAQQESQQGAEQEDTQEQQRDQQQEIQKQEQVENQEQSTQTPAQERLAAARGRLRDDKERNQDSDQSVEMSRRKGAAGAQHEERAWTIRSTPSLVLSGVLSPAGPSR